MALSLSTVPIKTLQASLNEKNITITENHGLNSSTGFWWIRFTFDHGLEKGIKVHLTNFKYPKRNVWTLEVTKCSYLGITSKEQMTSFDMVDEVVNRNEFVRLNQSCGNNEKLCDYIRCNIIPIVTKKIKHTRFKPQFRFFLSHKSTDKPIMRTFVAGLKFLGYDTWLDEKDLPPGALLIPSLSKAVENCDCFIAWLNKDYMESEYCKAELLHAKGQGKIIFTFGNYSKVKEYMNGDLAFLKTRVVFNPSSASFFEILRRIDEALFEFETLPI